MTTHMKTLLLLVLLALPAWAEDWTFAGKTYQGVKVVRVEADVVTILDSDGGANVLLAEMPTDLQKRFNYDPAKAAIAARQRQVADKASSDAIAAQQKRDAIARAQQASDAAKEQAAENTVAKAQAAQDAKTAIINANRAEMRKNARVLIGYVMQKLPDGYLVESTPPITSNIDAANATLGIHKNSDGTWSGSQNAADSASAYYVKDSTLFVETSRDMVDGDPISMSVYPTGEFSYTNTLGAQATVRKYAELPPSAQTQSVSTFDPIANPISPVHN